MIGNDLHSGDLYLAIDSGASNTRVLIFRYRGEIKIIKRSLFEGFNYSVSGIEGLEVFWDKLIGILIPVLKSECVGFEDVYRCRLIVGLAAAGIGRSDVKKRFIRDFERVIDEGFLEGRESSKLNKSFVDIGEIKKIVQSIHFYFMHDGESALWGVFPDGVGIVVNAGTGSIAFGRTKEDRIVRAGGWGHIVGDEGSAYWIAVRAISLLLRRYDGRGALKGRFIGKEKEIEYEVMRDVRSETILESMLLDRLGLDSIEEIVEWIHSKTIRKAEIASLAKEVTRAALGGDMLAIEVLIDAGRELFILVRGILERMIENSSTEVADMERVENREISKGGNERPVKEMGKENEQTDGIRVGMIGSVFAKDSIVRKSFTELLKKNFPDIAVFLADVVPAMGAARCLIYKLKNGHKPDLVFNPFPD